MKRIRPRSTGLLVACLCCAAAPGLLAQAVYKSVDAEGNVTYSGSLPPAGSAREVEALAIDADPAPAESEAASERMQALEQASQQRANAAAESRAERQQAISAAQQDLIRAKAELEQSKIQGDGDWQWLARGGRVLSAAYFERVAAAEAQVAAAEKALEAARRAR